MEWFRLSLQRRRVSSKEDDKVIWIRSKNDKFSVEGLCSVLELGSEAFFLANLIWNSWVPPKGAFFA